jgi:hypothetical protein
MDIMDNKNWRCCCGLLHVRTASRWVYVFYQLLGLLFLPVTSNQNFLLGNLNNTLETCDGNVLKNIDSPKFYEILFFIFLTFLMIAKHKYNRKKFWLLINLMFQSVLIALCFYRTVQSFFEYISDVKRLFDNIDQMSWHVESLSFSVAMVKLRYLCWGLVWFGLICLHLYALMITWYCVKYLDTYHRISLPVFTNEQQVSMVRYWFDSNESEEIEDELSEFGMISMTCIIGAILCLQSRPVKKVLCTAVCPELGSSNLEPQGPGYSGSPHSSNGIFIHLTVLICFSFNNLISISTEKIFCLRQSVYLQDVENTLAIELPLEFEVVSPPRAWRRHAGNIGLRRRRRRAARRYKSVQQIAALHYNQFVNIGRKK